MKALQLMVNGQFRIEEVAQSLMVDHSRPWVPIRGRLSTCGSLPRLGAGKGVLGLGPRAFPIRILSPKGMQLPLPKRGKG